MKNIIIDTRFFQKIHGNDPVKIWFLSAIMFAIFTYAFYKIAINGHYVIHNYEPLNTIAVGDYLIIYQEDFEPDRNESLNGHMIYLVENSDQEYIYIKGYGVEYYPLSYAIENLENGDFRKKGLAEKYTEKLKKDQLQILNLKRTISYAEKTK